MLACVPFATVCIVAAMHILENQMCICRKSFIQYQLHTGRYDLLGVSGTQEPIFDCLEDSLPHTRRYIVLKLCCNICAIHFKRTSYSEVNAHTLTDIIETLPTMINS